MEDEDVGIKSVELTLKPSSLDDDKNETKVEVTVDVTLDADASAATTVNVVLTRLDDDDDDTADDVTVDLLIIDEEEEEEGVQDNTNDLTHTVEVVFAIGNRTKSVKHFITIDPETDSELDDEVVVLQGVGTVEDANGGPSLFTSTGTVNFTINDTENGVASIVLEVSPTELDDTADVTALVVTATVNMRKDVDSATPVTVALSVGNEDDDGDTAEDGDYTLTPANLPSIIVIIPSGSKTGEASVGLSIDPTEDVGDPDSDNEVLALKGTVTQDSESITDVATVTINDATPSGGLTLEVEPKSVSEADGSTTVTITASIDLINRVDADTDVTVSLALDDEDDGHTAESGDYGISTLPDIVVTILSGKKAGSEKGLFTLDPVVDADTDADDIVIKGTATVGTTDLSGTATLSITDGVAATLPKNAADADGFRVEITAPDEPPKWAKVGPNQVKVQVIRRDVVAQQWGNFTSIRVALHSDDDDGDTDDTQAADEVYALTVLDGGRQLSNLSLASVKTDSLASSQVKGVNDANTFPNKGNKKSNIIAYTKQSEIHDYLEFRFDIKNAATADDLKKVFAVVTFKAGTKVVGKIDSRDVETTIYPENPSLFTATVGDGKFIQIDRSKPVRRHH